MTPSREPRPDARPLSGAVALVTGAARRVGRAVAERLAAAGAAVAVHAHAHGHEAAQVAQGIVERGGRALALTADLTDDAAARGLVDETERRLGPLTLLVNSAARFAATPLASLRVEDLDALWALNTRAPFVLTLEAGRRMAARAAAPSATERSPGPGPCVVQVACTSGLSPWGGYVPYSASKAALVSLTRGFARALAPHVRVNAVAPGPVLAPDGLAEPEAARIAGTTLLGRWGEPADVAEAVLFLATSPWLTGVVLPVDGGRSAR